MLEKERRIRLTPEGYRKVCEMVDERASPDGFIRCEWCGKSIGRFHHHHIRFRSAWGSDTLENLILLCENCHSIYAHGRKGKLYRKEFVDYRMNVNPIKAWNEAHKEKAEGIYEKYGGGKKK